MNLERYFEKSGDTEIITDNLIENEHGFASYFVNGDRLVICNVFGDGEFWDAFFLDKARELGLKRVTFGTRRNYKAFEKKFGYKLTGYILEKEVYYG